MIKFIRKVLHTDISRSQKHKIIKAYYKEMGYKGIDMYEYPAWRLGGYVLICVAVIQILLGTLNFQENSADSIYGACVALFGGLITLAYGNKKLKEYKKYRFREDYTYINVTTGNYIDYFQFLQRFGIGQVKSIEYDEVEKIGKIELKRLYR